MDVTAETLHSSPPNANLERLGDSFYYIVRASSCGAPKTEPEVADDKTDRDVVEQLIFAERYEDIPESSVWKKQIRHGFPELKGFYHAWSFHRAKKPPLSGLWARFKADLFGASEYNHLHKADCKLACPIPLRFLRILDSGMLVFSFDNIKFSLDPKQPPIAAERIDLDRDVFDQLLQSEPVFFESENGYTANSNTNPTNNTTTPTPTSGVLEKPIPIPTSTLEDEATPYTTTTTTTTPSPPMTTTPSPTQTTETEFCVGGLNTNDAIEKATNIGGTSFEELTAHMQPYSSWSHKGPFAEGEWSDYSSVGFLKRRRSLKAQLLIDNETVVQGLGVTHQTLLAPLLLAIQLHSDQRERVGLGLQSLGFHFNGQRFSLTVSCFSGSQESPFMDGTGSGTRMVLQNEQTKEKLTFEGLGPIMAYKYGFYQSGSCRLDPLTLWNILHKKIDKA